MGREVPALQRQFHRMLAREILRDQGIMMLLGNMNAEERVAAFLVSLGRRLESRGLPGGRFHLPMSRGDIGRYLGLKPETVSRAITRFQDEGLVTARGKHIEILDAAGLQAVLGLQHPDAPFLA
jgi:CRP/FNR family transcriptional regulator